MRKAAPFDLKLWKYQIWKWNVYADLLFDVEPLQSLPLRPRALRQ